MSNQIPRPPLFASANPNANTDDFDLSEVFAEYFFNDYDDPLNVYTGGMANYGTTINILPSSTPSTSTTTTTSNQQQGNNNISSKTTLPTGGIRTAFHTGGVTGNSNITPITKKIKIDTTNNSQQQQQQVMYGGQQQQQPQQIQQHQQQALLPQLNQFPISNTTFTSNNNNNNTSTSTSNIPSQHQQQQQQQHQPTQIANVALSGGIALPVGIGIRLGGIGGIVPNNNNNTNNMTQQQQSTGTTTTSYTNSAGYNPGMMWNNSNYSNNNNYNTNLDFSEEGMTEEAITERRQRNREHAKRSRVRKKFMLESMQEEVLALQRENHRLRLLVQENIPEHAMQIISECCTYNPLFGNSNTNNPTGDTTMSGTNNDESNNNNNTNSNIPASIAGGDKTGRLDRSDYTLMQSLAAGQRCFVLSDPKLPDNPIVFATPDFYKLTGYTSEEVLGRNCRFLQGPGTDKRAVDVIRKAVSTGSDATVCLINYKADGTPFWNQFFIAALRDSDNNIVNFVGVQTEVEPETSLIPSLEDKVNAVLPLQHKE